jgi:hypothetical protein
MRGGDRISWDIICNPSKRRESMYAIMTSTTTPNLPAPRTKTLPSNRENSQLEKWRLWSKRRGPARSDYRTGATEISPVSQCLNRPWFAFGWCSICTQLFLSKKEQVQLKPEDLPAASASNGSWRCLHPDGGISKWPPPNGMDADLQAGTHACIAA